MALFIPTTTKITAKQFAKLDPEETTWEPEDAVTNASELVKEFHLEYPDKPQRTVQAQAKRGKIVAAPESQKRKIETPQGSNITNSGNKKTQK
ncbi:hypothetical protein ACM66B_003272 [Microbotryomycetes sp. NB124-2]